MSKSRQTSHHEEGTATTDMATDSVIPPVDADAKVLRSPKDLKAVLAKTLSELHLALHIAEPNLENFTFLNSGGSGLIETAVDKALGRIIAVKSLLPDTRHSREAIERLVREAIATAALEHPNIVPLHTIGACPERGVYFTMKRLRGDSLRSIITQLAHYNPAYTSVYTHARRISIFLNICQGMDYAHSKGIMHRDLKPENILIGNYGEVTIIDWGLVKSLHSKTANTDENQARPSRTTRLNTLNSNINFHVKNQTSDGNLSGTLRFMSPEQAAGQISELDERTDIYALGVILYELLTFKNPFQQQTTETDIIDAVQSGKFQRPRHTYRRFDISHEEEAICLKAMALNKENRYQSVSDMIRDIYAYQEDRPVSAYRAPLYMKCLKVFHRNPLKTAILSSLLLGVFTLAATLYILDGIAYRETMLEARQQTDQAVQQLSLLDRRLAEMRPQGNISQDATEPNHDKDDMAIHRENIVALRNEIDNHFDEAMRQLNTISQISRHKADVRELKERILRERIYAALRQFRLADVEKWLEQARSTFGNNFEGCSAGMYVFLHNVQIDILGDCLLSIDTIPSNQKLRLDCIGKDADTDKLAVTSKFDLDSSRSPLAPTIVPKGNYLLTISTETVGDIRVPITLKHGDSQEVTLKIPKRVPEGTHYIPEGPVVLDSPGQNTHPVQLDGFFISTYEVTFRQYLEFWTSLENENSRNAYASRIFFDKRDLLPTRAWDDDGNLLPGLSLDRPVIGVSIYAAQHFCTWLGEKLDRPCRLPTAEEWEKAARGSDERLYPWGNVFHAEYTYTYENTNAFTKYGLWAPPGSFPDDCSIYGVYDMAGNVREWTCSVFENDPTFYQIKGGSSVFSRRYLPLTKASDMVQSPSDVGFRYIFPVVPEDFTTQQKKLDNADSTSTEDPE